MIILFLFFEFFIYFISLILVIFILDFSNLVSLIGRVVDFHWWILKLFRRVEFEVNEFEENEVEIKEGGHHTIVNLDRQTGWVFEGNRVCDGLTHYFALIVDAFDTNEHFAEGVWANDVQLKVF